MIDRVLSNVAISIKFVVHSLPGIPFTVPVLLAARAVPMTMLLSCVSIAVASTRAYVVSLVSRTIVSMRDIS